MNNIHMGFVGTLKIYLHTKFHIRSSNDLFVIVMQPKAKRRFHEATMLWFYSIQNITLTKAAQFLKTCQHRRTSFQDPIFCGASVAPPQKLVRLPSLYYPLQ
jgi:hypothetical protein